MQGSHTSSRFRTPSDLSNKTTLLRLVRWISGIEETSISRLGNEALATACQRHTGALTVPVHMVSEQGIIDSRASTTSTTCSLVGIRLTRQARAIKSSHLARPIHVELIEQCLDIPDGKDLQRIHTDARIVDLQFTVAAIDHVQNAIERQGRLGNVGSNYTLLPPSATPESVIIHRIESNPHKREGERVERVPCGHYSQLVERS